jgi:hypothetical protein
MSPSGPTLLPVDAPNPDATNLAGAVPRDGLPGAATSVSARAEPDVARLALRTTAIATTLEVIREIVMAHTG